jgi:hypothetical protein
MFQDTTTFQDPDHPKTTVSGWHAFPKSCRHLIRELVDRKECNLPYGFLPLAHGAAIASDALLDRAGYRPGMGCPPDWYEVDLGVFKWQDFLMVRECEGTGLWTVERLRHGRRVQDVDQVLVHVFGSTPIFTRDPQASMWLAEYCQASEPPQGLRWVKAIPESLEPIILAVDEQRREEDRYAARKSNVRRRRSIG